MAAIYEGDLVGGCEEGCNCGQCFWVHGAGPTAVAVVDDEVKGKEIGERMVKAF